MSRDKKSVQPIESGMCASIGCLAPPDRFLVHSERNISYFISTFPTSMVKVEMLIVEMFLPLKSRVLRHVHSLVTKVSSLVIPSER